MIHPTAIIAPGAKLHSSVSVGPYTVIGEHVTIGQGTRIASHVVIEGYTEIGCDNQIFQFSSIGAIPQDLKYRQGAVTTLKIGDRNCIRECVTIHLGTEGGGGVTTVGNNILLMAYAHVAHDCVIGDHVVLANAVNLAGHVLVGDYAILGGLSAVHQFTHVGCHAMVSGGAMVAQDVIPYAIAQGDRAKPIGINNVGLKRRGFSDEAIAAIKQSYRLLFRSGLTQEKALEEIINKYSDSAEVATLVNFVRESQRGLAR